MFAAPKLLKVQHPLPGTPGAPDELRLGGYAGHPATPEQRVRGFKHVAAADQSRDAEAHEERVRSAVAGARGGRGDAERGRGAR